MLLPGSEEKKGLLAAITAIRQDITALRHQQQQQGEFVPVTSTSGERPPKRAKLQTKEQALMKKGNMQLSSRSVPLVFHLRNLCCT